MADDLALPDPLTFAVDGAVAIVTFDDGKANAFSHDVLAALHRVLDLVEGDDGLRALLLAGRPGMFSGGFDLKVMRSGPREAVDLALTGGELFLRMYESPVPIVTASTGHAVAAGALCQLVADARVGAAGEFQIGLIEVAIGMSLPRWAVELAEERLDPAHRQQATVTARMYDPEGARAAGYYDVVVAPDAVVATAKEEADRLAALDPRAYAVTVKGVRGERIRRIRESLAHDRETMTPLTG